MNEFPLDGILLVFIVIVVFAGPLLWLIFSYEEEPEEGYNEMQKRAAMAWFLQPSLQRR